MRTAMTCIALISIIIILGCAAQPTAIPRADPPQKSAPGVLADPPLPMASFAGMVRGRWKRTFTSGTSMFNTWHWGPVQLSMRAMTDGFGADGQPWHEVRVFFWHPGLKQIRLWGASPFAQGVSEGSITFDSKKAEGVMNLQQFGFDPKRNGGHRKMGLRWTFDGPDKYRDVLLEDNGRGLETLVEWDHFRIPAAAAKNPRPAQADAPEPSEHLKALHPFLGTAWESEPISPTAGQAPENIPRFRTTFDWVPYAEVVYARTVVLNKNAEPTHLLDAYIHHHAGLNALRVLAFTKSGGVYEGTLTLSAERTLQLDLKGIEGERVVPTIVQLDIEKDGRVHDRIWTVDGNNRTLVLDIRHKNLGQKSE